LKASAEKGSASSGRRTIGAPDVGSTPIIGGTSSGLGRKSTTASSSGCTPLFLNDAPQRDGNEGQRNGSTPERRQDGFGGKLPAGEIQLHQRVILLAGRLDEFLTQLAAAHAQIGGDILLVPLAPRLSSSQIMARRRRRSTTPTNDPSIPEPIRVLHGDRAGAEAHADHLQHALEVGTRTVHLVMKAMRGTCIIGLVPDGFGLGSTPPTAQKNGNRAVKHPEAALDFDGKSTCPGVSISFNAVFAPETGGGGRGDGDSPLLLLLHVIHGRGTVVHLAHPVGDTGE